MVNGHWPQYLSIRPADSREGQRGAKQTISQLPTFECAGQKGHLEFSVIYYLYLIPTGTIV